MGLSGGSEVKHLPAIWETWVQSLGQEDPLEKEMATHSSILAWRNPWMEEPGGLQSKGSQWVGYGWETSLPHRVSATSRLWKIVIVLFLLFNFDAFHLSLIWLLQQGLLFFILPNFLCFHIRSLLAVSPQVLKEKPYVERVLRDPMAQFPWSPELGAPVVSPVWIILLWLVCNCCEPAEA